MFTAKFYANGRQRIYSAEFFTILRSEDGRAEITLHMKDPAHDFRVDIEWEGWSKAPANQVFQRAIIENAAGRTTEIVNLGPDPRGGGGLIAAGA